MSDSALLYLNTHHAIHDGGGRYVFNIQNSLYVEKAVRISPISASVANIFPNVSSYKNAWIAFNGGANTPNSVTVGQYSIASYVTAFNLASTNLVLSYDAVTERFTLTGSDILAADKDFFELLGFQDQIVPTAVVLLDGYPWELNVAVSLVATSPPNFGGEKVVHLMCDKIGHTNMIYGKDGTPYDQFGTISFHDVDYGQTGHFRSAEVLQDDINYKYDNNLDTLIVELRDSRLRPLALPSNYEIHMVFKVFHRDNGRAVPRNSY